MAQHKWPYRPSDAPYYFMIQKNPGLGSGMRQVAMEIWGAGGGGAGGPEGNGGGGGGYLLMVLNIPAYREIRVKYSGGYGGLGGTVGNYGTDGTDSVIDFGAWSVTVYGGGKDGAPGFALNPPIGTTIIKRALSTGGLGASGEPSSGLGNVDGLGGGGGQAAVGYGSVLANPNGTITLSRFLPQNGRNGGESLSYIGGNTRFPSKSGMSGNGGHGGGMYAHPGPSPRNWCDGFDGSPYGGGGGGGGKNTGNEGVGGRGGSGLVLLTYDISSDDSEDSDSNARFSFEGQLPRNSITDGSSTSDWINAGYMLPPVLMIPFPAVTPLMGAPPLPGGGIAPPTILPLPTSIPLPLAG